MTNLNNFCVYMHTSPSGKSYIGQTNDYARRCRLHRSKSSGCKAISNAIQKYGWDNFTHKIIEDNLSLEDANELEEFLIEECNTLSPNGYNLKTGGSNSRPNQETIDKVAAAHKGKTISQETRDKISVTLTGIIRSQETRKRIAEAQKGEKSVLYGVKLKEEVLIARTKAAIAKRLPYNELPNTIEEAISRGLKLVKQTTPCKKGHLYARCINVKLKVFARCLDCKRNYNILI